jgi:hypothetical protein
MIQNQLNLKWVIVGACITLNGCNTYEMPPKEPLKCGAEYPCNDCTGGCPYTSSYKVFFAPKRVN